MSPAARLAVACVAPLAIAGIAIALRPSSVVMLAIAGGVAAVIALVTGLVTAVRDAELSQLLKRVLFAVILRLVLTGIAVLALTRIAPADALSVALVLAGGVAAAVLCEAFLLIPQRESARA